MITKVIPEEKVIATYKAIQRAKRIVIVAHKRPDGDAIGSSLGLYHFLYSFERETFVIMPDAIPANMSILPSSNEILNYELETEKCNSILAETDLVFCLDFNKLERIGELGKVIANSHAEKVMIDHHLDYEAFADIAISHPEIASTSELIFRLICRMGYFADMNLQTAECICAGMLTDTGGLAYNSNSPEIYTIFAELLRKGVDKDALYRHLFNTYKENRMRLMGYVLSQKLEILPEYQTAIFSLSEKELAQYNYEKGDTEGFVNLPLSIQGIRFSIFAREEKDTVKLSLRSVGDFPANQFANQYFDGGGHLNASGAESKLSLSDTIKKIKEVLPAFCEEIDKQN